MDQSSFYSTQQERSCFPRVVPVSVHDVLSEVHSASLPTEPVNRLGSTQTAVPITEQNHYDHIKHSVYGDC